MKYTGLIELTVEADSLQQARDYIAFATVKLSLSDRTIIGAAYDPDNIAIRKQKPDITLLKN